MAVSKMGVGRLIFPPEGVKICGDTYLSLLEKEAVPNIKFRMKAHSDPKSESGNKTSPPHIREKASFQN